MLTESIPQFNLSELQWYTINADDIQHVYDNSTHVVDIKLVRVLRDVAQDIDDYMYTNIQDWMVQHQFWNYMKDVEWWQQLQFVSAILGALCWVIAIAIYCCYKHKIIATNLGSQKLEDFELIKIMRTRAEAAPTLPPHVESQF